MATALSTLSHHYGIALNTNSSVRAKLTAKRVSIEFPRVGQPPRPAPCCRLQREPFRCAARGRRPRHHRSGFWIIHACSLKNLCKCHASAPLRGATHASGLPCAGGAAFYERPCPAAISFKSLDGRLAPTCPILSQKNIVWKFTKSASPVANSMTKVSQIPLRPGTDKIINSLN